MKFPSFLFVAAFLVGCGSGSSSVQNAGDVAVDDTTNAQSDDSTASGNSNQQGADPLIQNTTNVAFDITVPAYQSNELKVEVLWGEIKLTAQWVGDELWQATGEFPTATEDSLSVTFFDNNGDLELAVYSQAFKTGFNAGETVQVTADQFDSIQFDEDADGRNNLEELLAGSDPLMAETKDLPIKFSFRADGYAIILPKFESSARRPRPYSYTEEVPLGSYSLAPTQVSSTSIQIDSFGNGSRFYKNQYIRSSRYHEEHNATRTYTGSSVVWAGSDYLFNALSEYSRDVQFTVEASRVNAQSIRVEATYESEYLHESRPFDFQNVTYNLNVLDASGFQNCLPDSGTYTVTWGDSSPGDTRSKTATKNVGDEYWHVLTTLNGSTSDEYLTTWVNMEVFCNYADLD